MPAIAPVQAALRRSIVASSRRPLPYHSRARLASNSTRFANLRLHGLARERLGRAERRELDAELVQVFLRQVDAVVEEVLADVAQDVRQLERDAEVVGQLVLPLRLRGAVDAQAQPADAARDAAAVPEQVVERLVGGLVDVGEAAVDELLERLERGREARARVGRARPAPGPPSPLSTVSSAGRDVALDLRDQGVDLLPGGFELRRLLLRREGRRRRCRRSAWRRRRRRRARGACPAAAA